jgi:integrase
MKVLGKSRDWREENRLKPPKQYTPNKNPLTQNEVLKMFKNTENEYKQNAILKILYYGLLRRGELRNLNLEDIDYQRNKIRINAGKGNKYATINLHPDAIESVKRYLQIRKPIYEDEKALFLNIYGKRIGSTEITNILKRTAFKVGIKKNVYPHLMRISGITHLSQKGINLKIIQQQSRHSDIETLLGYVQPSENEIRDEYLKGISIVTKQRHNRPYVTVSPPEENNVRSARKSETNEGTLKRKTESKPKETDDKTDKYIALLQEGLISAEDFKTLVTKDEHRHQKNYIY